MNKTITIIIGLIVVGSGAFYGGMKYNQSQTDAASALRQASREQGGGTFGVGGRGARGVNGAGGFASGEVLSKDDKSITIKLRDGGSKIVFFSSSTEVTKSASGALSDVTVGEQVNAVGTANSDGSVTAQSVQIRPAQPQ